MVSLAGGRLIQGKLSKMKPNKVRVMMYEPYPFGKIAGNLRTQMYILDLIDRDRFDVVLAAPFESDFTRAVREKGIRVVILPPSGAVKTYGQRALKAGLIGKLGTVLDIFKYNLKLRKLLISERIDVLYCNGIRGVLTCGISAKLSQVPLLWYVKGELQFPLLDLFAFIISDRILFFCGANKHDKYPWLVKFFNGKIGILAIGLDITPIRKIMRESHRQLREELGISSKDFNIGFVGQLYKPKGVHVLLEAVGSLIVQYPELKVYVIGHHIIKEYADYKKELEQQIAKYGISDRVVFTGWREDALHIVSQMDCLVHPSFKEGFGRAVLEAMALGKAVIASSVGGLREAVIDGENGMLVPPGDPEALKRALVKILENRELVGTFGQNAHQTVLDKYLIEDKIIELQNELVEMVGD